jgi:hypothetical protein
VKTHDRSETFVLQGNIVIIHQSLLNSIFTTKLYTGCLKIASTKKKLWHLEATEIQKTNFYFF